MSGMDSDAKAPRWERISDKHKTGVLLAVLHENRPGTMKVVRWDEESEHDPLKRGSHAEARFTHAIILPEFEAPNEKPATA